MTAIRVTGGNAPGRLGEIPGMTTEHDPAAIHGVLPSTPPPPPRPRRRWPWAVAAVVVAAALGASAVVLLERPSTPAPPAAGTFTMTGVLDVAGTGQSLRWDSEQDLTCWTVGGYADVVAGAAVTVADPQGRTVATGSLAAGTAQYQHSDALNADVIDQCDFAFTVPGVPDNLASYSVTIGHRGTQVVQAADVHGQVTLTLGDGG